MLEAGTTIEGLSGSYICEAKQGEGGFGIVWRGKRTADDAKVILKELRVEWLKDWKALELFEREAAALKRLKHSGIPTYCDFFAWDGTTALPVGSLEKSRGASLVLVQEEVLGESLAAKIDGGARLGPEEARKLLRSLLEILVYLHELHPPIIHRDITPANVIVRADGTGALIDFGGVQDRLRLASSGSTTIGTFGYMPIEQHSGVARPASDLYALGMTMLSALSHAAPHEMPIDELTSKVKVASVLPNVDVGLRDVLSTMVEPIASRRASSARSLLVRLDIASGDSKRPMLLLAILLLLLCGGIYASKNHHRFEAAADDSDRIPHQASPAPPPVPAPPPPRPLKTLAYSGKVRSADGLPIKVGAFCSVNLTVGVFFEASFDDQLLMHLTIHCGGKLLYEETAADEKSASRISTFSEDPGYVPNTYREEVRLFGGKTPYSVSVDTRGFEGKVTRNGDGAFHVVFSVDPERSSATSTVPLRSYTTKSSTTYRTMRSRPGKIVSSTDKRYPVGATCAAIALPNWADDNNKNCNVVVLCNEQQVVQAYGTNCVDVDPFVYDDVRFANDTKTETKIDFGSGTVRYTARSPKEDIAVEIKLDPPPKPAP